MSPPVSAMITRATCSPTRGWLQQLQLVRPRPAGLGDHRIERIEGDLHPLQAVQHALRQPRVVLVEAAGQRFGQRRDLDPHAAPGQLGEHLRIPFASDQRAQQRPRRDRGQAGSDRRQLDRGVSRHQLQPGGVLAAVAHQLHPVAGQHPQPADLRRRHERRADQAELQQLGGPFGVLDVGLAPRGVTTAVFDVVAVSDSAQSDIMLVSVGVIVLTGLLSVLVHRLVVQRNTPGGAESSTTRPVLAVLLIGTRLLAAVSLDSGDADTRNLLLSGVPELGGSCLLLRVQRGRQRLDATY
jgi:hypothetical protein